MEKNIVEVDVLILGAGVTGLSLSSFIKNDFIIIDREDEIGGYCKTTNINGFIWDYSGHFFHFNNKEIKEYICENVDCDILEISKISKIFYNKTLIDFPFQSNIHQLDKSEFIECLVDLYNIKSEEISNFEEVVVSKFGKSISNKFIIPYNSKLYACDLKKLDANCMGRFISSVNFQDIINSMQGERLKSYNDSFVYPEKGCFEFIKSISKRIDNSKIRLKEEVLEIDLKEKLVLTNKSKYKFQKLVSTLPFNKFLLLSKTSISEKEFSSNKVVVFNLGFDKKSNTDAHWIYYPGSEIFYRVGFYDNILDENRMSLYVEIGFKTDQKIDKEYLLSCVIKDLRECGIVTDHKLLEHQMLILDPAYVHITKESVKYYQDWCDEYNQNNIYSIDRYGSWTYCSIEDNIIQSKKISKLL